MKRPLRPDEQRLWGVVAATIHPLSGRAAPVSVGPVPEAPAHVPPPTPPQRAAAAREGLDPIEPRRRRRIAMAREEIGARLDLHGLGQAQARAALEGFVRRAWEDGWRAVLVITGKGVQGGGVLRRLAPEWLAAPDLAHIVAGVSHAARHHGGEGALYVALKRRRKT